MKDFLIRLIVQLLLIAALCGLIAFSAFRSAKERHEAYEEKYEEGIEHGVEVERYNARPAISYYLGMAMAENRSAYKNLPEDLDQCYQRGYQYSEKFNSPWGTEIHGVNVNTFYCGVEEAYKDGTGKDDVPESVISFMRGCLDGFAEYHGVYLYD